MKGMKEYRELTERLYKVPQSVQQLIPVHRIAEDGIFLLENKPEGAEVLFDKAYLFLDTNFATMDDAEKDDFLRQYCMLLNSLSVSFKVIVINNNQDLAGVHQQICIRERDGQFSDMVRSFNRYIEDCVMRGQAGIYAETEGTPHNTITPICRRRNGAYEMDLVLRNNRTDEENPLGIFHPHAELHHIKKENIGLIEVMGLAVLPGRLKKELDELADALVRKIPSEEYSPDIRKHCEWASEIAEKYEINEENVHEILRYETGKVFARVLEDAGVYKKNQEGHDGFIRFLKTI